MENNLYFSMTVEETTAAMESDAQRGLDAVAVAERLKRYGRNELGTEKRRSWFMVALRQFRSGLTYILLVATVLAWYVGEKADAIGILLAVLIDAVAGFIQESRAEEAISKLKEMVVPECSVIRDGRLHRLPSAEVVPGDLLVLEEGDNIVADGRLIEAHDLRVVEAALTGESLPVTKSTAPVPADTALPDRVDMAWMGTAVIGGSARVLVTATGKHTAFGRIAASLAAIEHPPTPLEIQVSRLGRTLAVAAVGIVSVIFCLGLLIGEPLFKLFLFSVSMTVSVIPEGLPAVLAVVLALGVQRMARRHAVVRRLKSVDTLGAVNVICTDKTGTLTENRMTVREIALFNHRLLVTGDGLNPEGEIRLDGRSVRPADILELDWLVRSAGLVPKAVLEYRDGQPALVGDPTEGAMVVLAAKTGFGERQVSQFPQLDEIPFNSERKYRAVLREHQDLQGGRHRYLLAVGAFDALRDRAETVMVDGEELPFDDPRRTVLTAHSDEMAGRALRVLAVAMREVPLGQANIGDVDVRGLAMMGLVGMIDPPRRGVAESLASCRRAGIRVVMITGDHRLTALAVAREIGLVGEKDDATGRVFVEKEVAAMDDATFNRVVREALVFARVTPQTKLRIVEALEAQGQTVAMTGDGVNDAPALKRASVGVAMGMTGTDASREVADMVLADDNFVSIVNAVEEGRIIFRNVRQTTAYLVMTNFAEAVTVTTAILLGFPLPLVPAQILWMNLVTDGFPDVALATERSPEGVLDEPPRPRRASLLPRETLALAVIAAVFMTVGTLSIFASYLATDGLDKARTVAFTAMCVFQLWNVFNLRSERRSIFELGFASNPIVLAAVVVSLAIQVIAVYLPAMNQILRTVPLSLGDWLLVLLVTSSVFWAVEGYKAALRRGWIPAAWSLS